MVHVKRFSDFLNESLESKLAFIKGKPIDLIRTRITLGNWNQARQAMDSAKTEETVSGIIGDIGVDYDGYEFPGFTLLNTRGEKIGLVMYDTKKDEFIDGDSSFYYIYTGKNELDNRTLDLIKNNVI